ncbi:cytochrome P450 [Amycolatopsis sp. WAC 04197]|nr:cytochrome P450 [Amycolatopsis sp. WAC 04197]
MVEQLTRARNRQGGVAEIVLGGHRTIVVSEPESAHRVLVRHADNYTKLTRSHRTRVLMGDGLINATGAAWRRQRRVLQPQFTARALHRYENAIAESARATGERWAGHARTGRRFDLGDELTMFAQDVIWRAITGRPLDDEVARELASVERIVATLKALPVDAEAARKAVSEDLGRIDGLAKREIAGARAAGDRTGFLSTLVAAADRFPEYTDELIRDELVTLFAAGYETTATALTWTFVLLQRNPVARERLLAEATEPTSVAEALVREAMRLYPPVWLVPRQAVAEDTLGGRTVTAGMDVMVCPYLIHRDPQWWPDAEVFSPGRFGTPGGRPRHPGAYLPFGSGPRTCIGMRFALRESVALLDAVLPHFRTNVEHIPAGIAHGLTIRPDGPLPATTTFAGEGYLRGKPKMA